MCTSFSLSFSVHRAHNVNTLSGESFAIIEKNNNNTRLSFIIRRMSSGIICRHDPKGPMAGAMSTLLHTSVNNVCTVIKFDAA